jgi:hypothetical protein
MQVIQAKDASIEPVVNLLRNLSLINMRLSSSVEERLISVRFKICVWKEGRRGGGERETNINMDTR